MQIHERLKTLRQCKNWTQEDLAEKLGWGAGTYARMERGESDIKLDKLKQIADVIGVDVGELLSTSDKTVFNFAENCTQGNLTHTILLSETQCAHELDKARLMLEQKDKEIAWLKEEGERLKEIIVLLKKVGASVADDLGKS